MADREVIDACLKVVSNRCRNLRKAIDRAKTWEQAAAKGQDLNAEQLESVKSCVKKEALLAELQEILKKQTSIVERPEQQEEKPKISKRAAKAAKAKERRAKSVRSQEESTASSMDGTQKDDDSDKALTTSPRDAKSPDYSKESSAVAAPSEHLTADNRRLEAENQALRRELEDLKESKATEQNGMKKENVRKVLNLFHIVDFLRQQGSREALHGYAASHPETIGNFVTELDMDLLCYFNVMLTSPNGNVPHNEAVDVSTLHCLEFLQNSQLDAFKDTSYEALTRIVDKISSCPILTERGLDERAKAALQSEKFVHDGTNGNGPAHEVTDARANVAIP
ncbi:hypothetical protein BWQ96_03347 [Gracilariopsis chorda]|uniref:Uncharacterized protein n=1 Tax=Gracilariopsis chorda TaxID=448386 RepID=A0A2V3IXE6_9FLOR|nr:hypothetical protein BWQ96_03347 [Gracilariopsis chorda]|eukprot:PXF46818.1 hypothetical protein BWQ96_03347 [Gracilariopsis chorda]